MRVFGGLGNQLFQYAAGLFAARAWDGRLELDRTVRNRGTAAHPRRFKLDAFAIPTPLYDPSGVERLWWKIATTRNPRLRHGLGRFAGAGATALLDERIGHTIDARLSGPPPQGTVSMAGYWQCAAYAAAVEETLRRDLVFRTAPGGRNRALFERIRAEPASVSVHVRRGDYLDLDDAPVLPAAYYRQAVELIAARVGGLRIFVFSDTPDWARSVLEFGHATEHVDVNGEDAAEEDLRLMTMCRHHVIANSSFSWWGAWLAGTSGAVVAPKYWMMRSDTHYPDLFPESWIAIDNRLR